VETINAYKADPYSYREARALVEGLGLSEPVAVTLVRRGYRTLEAARSFLNADESHPPTAFKSMGPIVERLLAAVEARERIVIHGDFDVDGVCATTILVSALRDLGVDCDWLIPNRIGDGYGLGEDNIRRLAERETSLIVTVDCGITATREVALARSLGMDVIVTDHHQPGASLPDCLILHPSLDGYPFEHLCGTAVAWKLSCALREASGVGSPGTPREREPGDPTPETSDADLDLVALATVADVVPLIGENRSLVRRGIEVMRRARRPGLRALLKAASCDLARLDEGDLGFRLGPRINAAGRLYRADAGVELFLTSDDTRAAEIAKELGRANSERQVIERRVSSAAETARRKLSEELREAPALVLAGRDWHPGVIGITASRLAKHHYRPVIVISLDENGSGRGSGRSIPGFDLLGGLEACSEHLVRFGGHRAAAGLELEVESLEAFREAFVAHATEVLSQDDLKRIERIDAMVGGPGLALGLAEELEQVGPFGMGNPGVKLLVPSARVADVRTMGKEGKHARFNLHSGSHRSLAVAFGRSTLGVGEEDQVDAAVRLEVNRWNGSVEPRVVLGELYPLEAPGEESASLHTCECSEGEWWERFERERAQSLDPTDAMEEIIPVEREIVPHEASAAAVIAELVSSGAGVLVVCADASRRAALANGSIGLARFNGGSAPIACRSCGREAVAALGPHAGLTLVDYAALDAAPSLAGDFEHVVLVDVPFSASAERLATRPRGNWSEEEVHPGYLHEVWGKAEIPFAISVLEDEFAQRRQLTDVFKDLRDAGEVSGASLLAALRDSGQHRRSPESAARCFRVLDELGIVQGSPDSGTGRVGVVSSGEADLERSEAFLAYTARYQESLQFLDRRKQP
jgi:single-stranded-DNA-specific exonuclease